MNRRILVVGDALLDRYIYASSNRMSPEDPDCKIWDQSREVIRDGGALNVATNLSQLTLDPVNFAGIVTAGSLKYDLSPFCVWTQKPIYKTRLMDEATGKQILRIDNRSMFSGACIARFNDMLRQQRHTLSEYRIIVVSDYLKGTVSNELIEALKLNGRNSIVVVDTKRPDLSLWRDIPKCIVKVNESEFANSLNTTGVNLIVTRGAKGAVWIPKKDEFHGKPFMVEGRESAACAGVIGAGDAFLAGFVARFAERLDVREAMRYADLTARAYVRVPGTNVVSQEDVVREKNRDHSWYTRCDNWKS